MNCPYCNNTKIYNLANAQKKCARCRRKFSAKKIIKREHLWECFKNGVNATICAKRQKMHIATVLKHYMNFRKELAVLADREYNQNNHKVTGYDEYLYLPKSLKIEENIDKLQHFLTLSYEDRVYNIMMPSIKKYGSNPDKLLLKYLQFNRVSKISTAQNTITNFWDYFEEFILQYKGISSENFIYYLKEAEWRFNFELRVKS